MYMLLVIANRNTAALLWIWSQCENEYSSHSIVVQNAEQAAYSFKVLDIPPIVSYQGVPSPPIKTWGSFFPLQFDAFDVTSCFKEPPSYPFGL